MARYRRRRSFGRYGKRRRGRRRGRRRSYYASRIGRRM
jgi:hypothetical protein